MQSNMNIINGHFITLENNADDINSITIENGKIKSFNSPNPNFKTIDIKNNIVIPGFIDSHFHLKNYGKRQDMINLKKIDSIDQIVKLIRQKISQHPDIKWIEGFGWDHNLWGGNYPNSEILNSFMFSVRLYESRSFFSWFFFDFFADGFFRFIFVM